jgi:pantoate kinase
VLEGVAEPGWHDPEDVVRQIANEAETSESEVQSTLGDVWTTLLDGGLVRRQRAAA